MRKQIILLKRGAQKGFTLIELMIVFTVIAVLVAFALPAYQDYTIRIRVAEGLNLATSAKTAMTEYYNANHTWPSNNTTAGIADSSLINGNAVDSVSIADNVIKVTYKANVGVSGANVITIEASSAPAVDDSIIWKCGAVNTTVPVQYRPAECR